MSKIFKYFDAQYFNDFVVYPAWQGPQIVLLLDFKVTGKSFKILRKENTFPEDVSDGDLITSGTTNSVLVFKHSDKSQLNPSNWYYYSIFINDVVWKKIAYAECFTFGTNWARDSLWRHHIPETPYKKLDSNTPAISLEKRYFNYNESTGILSPLKDSDDPQEVLYDQKSLGKQHQLRRYIKYISFEIDKYADLVSSYPKLFRISDAPVFMLDLISELLKFEFRKDFSPLYKRMLLRFAIPRIRRKGVNQLIKWISRLILQNTSVYIEEYTKDVLYWTDVVNVKDYSGNDNNVVSNSKGSCWFGTNLTGGCFDAFVQGSFILDKSQNRIYSPYVYGIYIFFEENVEITEESLKILNHYIEKNISWLARYFVGLIQSTYNYHTDHTNHIVEIETHWNDLQYSIICWNYPDSGQGWNDPLEFLPDMRI